MTVPETKSRCRLRELLDPAFMTRLDALDVLTRKILHGKLQGERRGKRRGQSVEFADHRPYTVGDDLRFIDWNIYGRLDQLFLKLFIEEQDLTLHVAVDVSGSMSMGEPSKALAARRLAAALSYVGLVNNNRVELSAFADGVRMRMANMRGRLYLPRIAELLLTARAEGPSDFARSCRQLAGSGQASGVFVIISDFLLKEGFQDGLRRLMGGRSDVHVMQVLSPQELSPEFTGDLKLVDVEDADVSEITISAAMLRGYKKNLDAYCGELQTFCSGRRAFYSRFSSAESVQDIVLTQLRKYGLLG
jgi:uncharacterized protein (DUF58 family)